MKLSNRLKTIASFVPEGSKVADVGTDHGYIPIHLVQEGKAKHAIAMDVRKGPLMRAESHIAEAGLTDVIEVRLSDGLLKLNKNEADCVVIAGMGGELMIHILEEGKDLWDNIPCWVLSPQSELQKMRRFLVEQAFFVEQETMIKEDGKYYVVMRAVRTPSVSVDDGREVSYRYGKSLLELKDPVLAEYLEDEAYQLVEIRKNLSNGETESAKSRMRELETELSWNKEAQDAMR
jgi:tRNA (adenine22-N1)-methyltransferase